MKRIAVYSGTGGVGKSFIAANLASSLFQRGIRVTLCELATHNLIPMHFGARLISNDPEDSDHAGIRAKRNVPPLHNEPQFHSHVLHPDFTLMSANAGSEQSFDERLMSALQYAERMHGTSGLMVLDMPTNMHPGGNDLKFDVELEIVAAEPVCVAAAWRRHQAQNGHEGTARPAHEHFVIINKKDLRSDLSRDAATMAEALFADAVIGCIHYDSAVPEAFAHRSLLHDYAPHSQAGVELNELSRIIADLLELSDSVEKDLA